MIFQLGGMQSPAACCRALTPERIFVLSSGDSNGRVIGPLDRIMQATLLSRFVSQTLAAMDVKQSRADLESSAALIDAGALRPVVERTESLVEVPARDSPCRDGPRAGQDGY